MKRYVLLFCTLTACGGNDGANHLADAPQARLILDPPDLTVTIVDDKVVTQAYTAKIVQPNGREMDVTAETTFSMHDPAYGTFAGATLTVSGQGSGPTRVEASAQGATGDAGLVVFVRKTVVEAGGPTDAPTLFAGATEDPARAPTIAYPSDRILVPPNLGQFDVHWRNPVGMANNLFEVTMANQYVNIRLYTTGLDPKTPQPFWTVFRPSAWYPIASSREQLQLTVAGLDTAKPATKGTAAAQKVDVTNERTKGGIYYWTTSNGAAIFRYDVSAPDVAPAPYFADNARPSTCMGCHVLSRDGTKIAMTIDSANGRGALYNVADRKSTLAANVTPSWNFATFDSKATKLVTVESGKLMLRALDGAAIAGPLPVTAAGKSSTHPELSPDDTKLVSVEFTGGQDYLATGGSIVMRTFDTATNTFGAPTTIVPFTTGVNNWYPSFSPDGQWLVFTRTEGDSYDELSAQTWIVKADGSQPPVQLAIANQGGGLTNSWARWVPFAQTFGPENETMFYLTFSTKRAFGVRLPSPGRPQIWMTPVFPARAAAGQDPSGNAFRVPFQDVGTSNHIAQWTQAVVVQ